MRFVRWGSLGEERPGVLGEDGRVRDISSVVDDLSGAVLGRLDEIDPCALPVVDGTPRLGVPVAAVGKFIGIGLNFADHAAEAGMDAPSEPIVFMKATSSLTGPDDDVILPRGSEKSDWEVELGVVIGKTAKYVTEAEALAHVVSLPPICRSRMCRSTMRLPWPSRSTRSCWPLISANCSNATMIFAVAQIISYLSQLMTLHPGDIIATGTPPGVGMGMQPPRYLRPGDRMELEISGLGRQRQAVVAAQR